MCIVDNDDVDKDDEAIKTSKLNSQKFFLMKAQTQNYKDTVGKKN